MIAGRCARANGSPAKTPLKRPQIAAKRPTWLITAASANPQQLCGIQAKTPPPSKRLRSGRSRVRITPGASIFRDQTSTRLIGRDLIGVRTEGAPSGSKGLDRSRGTPLRHPIGGCANQVCGSRVCGSRPGSLIPNIRTNPGKSPSFLFVRIESSELAHDDAAGSSRRTTSTDETLHISTRSLPRVSACRAYARREKPQVLLTGCCTAIGLLANAPSVHWPKGIGGEGIVVVTSPRARRN